ncbi:MAG: histidinol dehydrogenase [Clostridia bacterium]
MIKIFDFNKINIDKVLNRKIESYSAYENTVKEIIEYVKTAGDKALYEYGEKFDKVKLTSLMVTKQEILEAYNTLDSDFVDVLKRAASNIEYFHSFQKREGFEKVSDSGVIVGQKFTPIEKVGIYVPGGTASYPSTVLMNALPAKIAGVKQIIMTTPPMPNGKLKAEILVAADIAGVDKIFKCGGAGAIAALAFGTESIPKVDKIVGPGNIFVALAKKQVFGNVGIDMVAGPSEILVVADNTAKAKNVAADLLSQAEHDKLATAVLITDSKVLANEVALEIEKQLEKLPRKNIAKESIDNNGKIIVVDNLDKGIEIANEIAPEHLELCVANPFDYLDKVINAGSIFLGMYTPEALGDYYAGPNHTLPTSGSAKFSSPLSVDDFIKKSSYIYYTEKEINKISRDVVEFANREGLQAHGKSILVRCKDYE